MVVVSRTAVVVASMQEEPHRPEALAVFSFGAVCRSSRSRHVWDATQWGSSQARSNREAGRWVRNEQTDRQTDRQTYARTHTHTRIHTNTLQKQNKQKNDVLLISIFGFQ